MLSIIGGIGGSVTMLSYNYWMREEKMSGPEQLGYVRGDIAIAYLFTALFGMAIMMTANQAFYVPGVAITNAQAVTKMAEMLGSILGAFGRVRVFDWVLGGGVCVAARRVAERAVLVCGLLQHPEEDVAGRARACDEGDEHAVSAGARVRHAGADSVSRLRDSRSK